MVSVELKQKVLRKLEDVEDDYLLEEVLALLEFETTTEPFKLTKPQISAIEEARLQIKKGEVYSNAEVEAEFDQWLNK
ncbi:MAG: hypothetical protein IPL23_03210 [Saprospiraceae bacterium]|nr:hypothetical protein [Saprospiraceae bacterium]MBK8632435.1 hypothetical protein [Saprospiraceae bacterium]